MTPSEMHELIESKLWYHIIESAPEVKTPELYDLTQVLETVEFPNALTRKIVSDIDSCDSFFAFEDEWQQAKQLLGTKRRSLYDLLNSKASYEIASVYDLSTEIYRAFDGIWLVGLFNRLPHSCAAFETIHSICNRFTFVRTHVLDHYSVQDDTATTLKTFHPGLTASPIIQFYPEDELNSNLSNWFTPNVQCVEFTLTQHVPISPHSIRPRGESSRIRDSTTGLRAIISVLTPLLIFRDSDEALIKPRQTQSFCNFRFNTQLTKRGL